MFRSPGVQPLTESKAIKENSPYFQTLMKRLKELTAEAGKLEQLRKEINNNISDNEHQRNSIELKLYTLRQCNDDDLGRKCIEVLGNDFHTVNVVKDKIELVLKANEHWTQPSDLADKLKALHNEFKMQDTTAELNDLEQRIGPRMTQIKGTLDIQHRDALVKALDSKPALGLGFYERRDVYAKEQAQKQEVSSRKFKF